MSFLEVGGHRLTIPEGESVVGTEPGAAIVLDGPGVLARHALLQATPDGQVAIRRGDEQAEILINGVHLGGQPTPLLHGDKVEVGGHELLFVDERRSGSTQYIQAVTPDALASAAGRQSGRAPTAGTGGRVVSLTDGREYTVEQSLVFGRDASCEVVITSKDVSRRHAEIMPTPQGYVIVDSSTNGTFVNGQRVHGQVVLARADVIKIGTHDFRFYADAVPPRVSAAPAPPAGADRKLANTLFGERSPVARPSAETPPAEVPPPPAAPAPPPAAAAPSAPAAHAAGRPSGAELAHLVIRSGTLKGQRLPVRTTLANIGRADYNDIVLPDDSVSTVHAKLQRREGIWVIVDRGSTNGTFADGEVVATEAPLAPGALLRFGEVRAFFEPADKDEPPVQGGSTKVLQAIRLPPESK